MKHEINEINASVPRDDEDTVKFSRDLEIYVDCRLFPQDLFSFKAFNQPTNYNSDKN